MTAHLRSVVGGRLLSPPGRRDHTTTPPGPTRAPLHPAWQHGTLPAASPRHHPVVCGTDARSASHWQSYFQGTSGCCLHPDGRELLQTPPKELKEQVVQARPSRPAHHKSSCPAPARPGGPGRNRSQPFAQHWRPWPFKQEPTRARASMGPWSDAGQAYKVAMGDARGAELSTILPPNSQREALNSLFYDVPEA